jgi:hypothetical protein
MWTLADAVHNQQGSRFAVGERVMVRTPDEAAYTHHHEDAAGTAVAKGVPLGTNTSLGLRSPGPFSFSALDHLCEIACGSPVADYQARGGFFAHSPTSVDAPEIAQISRSGHDSAPTSDPHIQRLANALMDCVQR